MPYAPSWDSLRKHQTPEWLRNAKFGIYTHWGPYAVPGKGPNATWYPIHMYHPGTEQYDYHVKTFGDPGKFGYKDFIPLLTGEKFDPDEWAELFSDAGARFAGPVGEHHDGFCMWDTAFSRWNAKQMGPRRDVVGELEKAVRAKNMKYMVALHHIENWWFFPHWDKASDCSDPRYADFYGEAHNLEYSALPPEKVDYLNFWDGMTPPSKAFLDKWLSKTCEVIDKYDPDLLWFDFGLEHVQEHYKRAFLAYYYNEAEKRGREVAVTYKFHHLAPGAGVVDIEQGGCGETQHNDWLTDTTVDDGQGWGYLKDTPYKTSGMLIRYLVDNVSKNGAMLLNVGPDPRGEIPPQAKSILRDIGKWLRVNGEAIYDTAAWLYYGEGPTEMKKTGTFNEETLPYTCEDIRYTCKGDNLYAISLGEPRRELTLKSLKYLYPSEIAGASMLGVDKPLAFAMRSDGLHVEIPDELPSKEACVIRVRRRAPFTKGEGEK